MPIGLRPLGIFFTFSGILLLILKFQFNIKPEFLDLKVFAFYSFYIESKSFTFITHQMIEEIGGVLLLSGLFLIAFTREKVELDLIGDLRLKAFFISTYLNFFYILISILFFYGFGFVGALTLFSISWLATFLLAFRWLLYQSRKKLKIDSEVK